MMFKKRIIRILSICLLPMILLTGCGQSNKVEKEDSDDLSIYELDNYEKDFENLSTKIKKNTGDTVRIGFSLESLKEAVWQRYKDEFIKKANELGAEVRLEVASGDDSIQMSQIDKLISEGINVLVVVPHDGEICAEAVEKAHNAGIKIIAFDRLIKNSDVDLYVCLDNYKAGVLQAEELLKHVSSGNIAYVGGSEADNNALLFRQGSMDVLDKHKDSINIVMDKYSKDWKAEEAYNNVTEFLSQSTDVKGIICANDSTASGTIVALQQFGLSNIPVTGLDADVSACQRVVEGSQLMTIYKPVKEISEKAAELSVKLAKGENIDISSTIYNGKIDVPTCLIQPIVVTKDNMMDTVIKDEFQDYDDVYENVPENERPKR